MENNKFQLPKPVEAHFQAANADDPVTFLSIFADDAVVLDAGKEYHGKAAIKAWGESNYFAVNLKLEVTNAVQDAPEIVVTAKCDGDYDKTGLPDPLYLDFHFTVEGDKVTRLRNVLSSNSKAVPLTQPIAAFYHASDVFDGELLAGCFAPNAVLHDEGIELQGPAAISGHILTANRDAKVSMDIMSLSEQNGETVVTAMLTGRVRGKSAPFGFPFFP